MRYEWGITWKVIVIIVIIINKQETNDSHEVHFESRTMRMLLHVTFAVKESNYYWSHQ